MQDLLFDTLADSGYIGIFLLMVLENVIPPVPSEVILAAAGVLVARGDLNFWILLLVASLGSVAGNYFWYWVGNKYGYERLEPFIRKHGRWLTVTFDEVEKAAGFFRKHGHWVVFFCRFSPVVRTLISLPAGLTHMPLVKFLGFTFAGSAIWNTVLILGGTLLAPLVERYETTASILIVGTVAVLMLYYFYRVATWKPREDGE